MRPNQLTQFILALLTMALYSSGCAEISELDVETDTDKILGGQDASSPESLVSIHVDGRFICGGTLIHKSWVLTAAHCVDHADVSAYKVCVGSSQLSQCNPDIESDVTKIVAHTGFDINNLFEGNDIAIIKLSRPLKGRKITRLATKQKDEPANGKKVRAFGWGVSEYNDNPVLPDQLQRIDLKFMSSSACKKYYSGIGSNIVCLKAQGEPNEPANKSVCNGDSGGPVYYKGVQIGIASFVTINNERQCLGTSPNAYTRVSSFRKWIMKKSDGEVKL